MCSVAINCTWRERTNATHRTNSTYRTHSIDQAGIRARQRVSAGCWCGLLCGITIDYSRRERTYSTNRTYCTRKSFVRYSNRLYGVAMISKLLNNIGHFCTI